MHTGVMSGDDDGCTDCLGRVPFGSLIAALLTCVGAGVWCGTFYHAFAIILDNIVNALFSFDIRWIDSVMVSVIVIGVLMAVISILLLVFAALATGATRRSVYSGESCIMGGRLTAGLFMIVTYILLILWTLNTMLMMIPTGASLMFHNFCIQQGTYTEHNLPPGWKISLINYGIRFTHNDSVPAYEQTERNVKYELTDYHDLTKFCESASMAAPYCYIMLAGSFVASLGLLHFLVGLSINYTHIKTTKEVSQYREIIELEKL